MDGPAALKVNSKSQVQGIGNLSSKLPKTAIIKAKCCFG